MLRLRDWRRAQRADYGLDASERPDLRHSQAPRRLFDFSPVLGDTVPTLSVPLYRWKVTRRDRAAGSGRQAGPNGLRTEASQASPMTGRWVPSFMRGSRPRSDRAASETARRRDRTRAPHGRRARRKQEIAGAPGSQVARVRDEASRSRSGEVEPGAGAKGE
jgi:hypothetical protein